MTIGTFLRASMFSMALISMTSVGCSGSQSSDTAAPGEPASAGEQLVEARCDRCHGLDVVFGESRTSEEWAAEVDTMIGRGARLDDAERQVVIDYLASR